MGKLTMLAFSLTFEIIRGTVLLLVAIAAVGWFLWTTIKNSDDPGGMVVKWIATAIALVILFKVVGPIMVESPFIGVPLVAACGLVFAAIWRHSLASLVASPFESLYTGGNVEPVPQPFYSVARANQKKGKYLEAIIEIRKQLARFPMDVEGQMLLAEVQAQDLKDLPGAELTIQRFCEQPGHAPQNIVYALYSMADWHLSVGRDPEAARRQLEKVTELLPDTEFALGAAQRIAHLADIDRLLSPEDRKKFIVPEGVQHLGLMKHTEAFRAAEADPAKMAAEYVDHLAQHPLDTEAREKLASIYADHYQRLDLATNELEQMIAMPNQPAKQVVRWLNLLADLQIRCGVEYDTVRETLQRIIDRDPNVAAAELARKRLALLKLDLKAREKNQDVKLGTYEQNIGLKRAQGPRFRPDG